MWYPSLRHLSSHRLQFIFWPTTHSHILFQQLIASLVLKQSSLRVAVTCDDTVVNQNEQALTKFLSSLAKDSVSVPAEPVRPDLARARTTSCLTHPDPL